jgi:hypothetical protein
MEAIYAPETSVDFHHTTLRYIPENIRLHIHIYGNLRYYKGKGSLFHVMKVYG